MPFKLLTFQQKIALFEEIKEKKSDVVLSPVSPVTAVLRPGCVHASLSPCCYTRDTQDTASNKEQIDFNNIFQYEKPLTSSKGGWLNSSMNW